MNELSLYNPAFKKLIHMARWRTDTGQITIKAVIPVISYQSFTSYRGVDFLDLFTDNNFLHENMIWNVPFLPSFKLSFFHHLDEMYNECTWLLEKRLIDRERIFNHEK